VRISVYTTVIASMLFWVTTNAISADSSQLEPEYQARFDAMMADLANPERSFEFVEVAVKAGDLRGAIAALERILKIEPDLSNIKLELGLLYLRVGSPDLAASYIRQTLSDPEVPVWIRNRAKVLLAQAEESASRHFFSGTLYAAGRYDSNANAAPNNQNVRVRGQDGLLDQEDTGQSDYSAELVGSFQYAYALDSQAGNQIEADFLLYNRRYQDQSRLNVNTIDLDLGPRFYFGEIYNPDFSVRPYVSGSYLLLDDDTYQRSFGGGLNVRKLFGLNLLTEGAVEGLHQDFSNTTRQPAATERTGPYYTALGRVTYQLLPTTVVTARAGAAKRDADENYESFDEWNGGLSVSRSFKAPFGLTAASWSSSLSTTLRRTVYDKADPLIDPDQKRKDTRVDVNLSFNIPLTTRVTMVLNGLYTNNDSSLPNFDYDNWGGGLGFAWSI